MLSRWYFSTSSGGASSEGGGGGGSVLLTKMQSRGEKVWSWSAKVSKGRERDELDQLTLDIGIAFDRAPLAAGSDAEVYCKFLDSRVVIVFEDVGDTTWLRAVRFPRALDDPA